MQEVRPADAPLVHAQGHGGEEEHHEKKPVTKKMKEKVKKLKNTVTKKIRGGDDHADDHEHQRDQYHDMDAEEEEEEEGGYQEDDEDKLVDPEPEVHGAPIYDTATVPDAVTGRDSREHENVRARESEEPAKVRFGDVVESTVEDPAAPNSSTPAPRGGEVISVSPIIQSFEAMSVGDKSDGPAGQRDQLSPVTPSKQGDEEMRDVEFEDLQEAAAAAPTAPTGSHDQFSPEEPSKQTAEEKQENQQSYTEKLKSAAAGTTEYGKKIAFVAYDKAAGAGAAAYDKAAGAGATAYDKAAGVGAVAYDKAAGAGSAVLAKVQPQGGGGGAAATTGEEGSGNRDKGVSMREYIAEKLKPGEEHKALSEVISDAVPTRKGSERRGEIEHKENEEVMSGSEGRSGGEEIERMAGDEVTGQEAREEVIAAGGETERKAGDEVVTGAETEQKAAEEVKGSTISDERRGGVTMMEKIRGAVTSLIGSNGTGSKSPKSPASDTKERDANANVVEETKRESEVR